MINTPEEMFSPFFTTRVMWCFSSLNKPGISNLQLYWPASASVRLRMVSETSPLASRPSNWYLLEALVPSITLRPSVEMSWFPQCSRDNTPRFQHAGTLLWDLELHDKVTFWPTYPLTRRLLLHSLTVGAKNTHVSDILLLPLHQLFQMLGFGSPRRGYNHKKGLKL